MQRGCEGDIGEEQHLAAAAALAPGAALAVTAPAVAAASAEAADAPALPPFRGEAPPGHGLCEARERVGSRT